MECHRLVLSLLLWVIAASASGAKLSVDPTNLTLSDERPITAMRVSNASDQPIRVQVRALLWEQSEDGETLTRTDDVIVSPPFVSVAPGSLQVVRVMFKGDMPQDSQRNYRIVIDELPGEKRSGRDLRLLLRYVLPLSMTQGDPAPADVSASVSERDDGLWLEVINKGQRRAMITDFALVSADGRVRSKKSGLIGYVHAGASQRWRVADSGSVTLTEVTHLRIGVDRQPQRIAFNEPAGR